MNRKFIYIGCTVFAMSLLSMTGVQAQEESKDSLVNVAFGKVAQEDLTHAISTVNTSELTKKTANNNSLVGLESFVGGYNGSSLWGQGKNPFFVMLDGVTDVRNFGAIARTCECAAVDAVVIPVRGSASVNADAVKTSAGALHTLPVCREQNLRSTLQYLKDSGFRIVAATEKGDYDYTKADYTGPLCIIMGAEDTGVSYENLALCDEWVKIPMLGTIESLNVSVAAGILIYEAVKQRNND